MWFAHQQPHQQPPKKATTKQIKEEYVKIAALKDSYGANNTPAKIKGKTTLMLSERAINKTFQKAYKSHKDLTKGVYEKLETYPAPAQLALINLLYNIGAGGLEKYKNLKKAIDQTPPNWQKASTECGVNIAGGKHDTRNAYNRNLFLQAQRMQNSLPKPAKVKAK